MLGSVLRYGACYFTTSTTRIEVSTKSPSRRQSFGLEVNKLAHKVLDPFRYLVGGHSLLLYTTRHGELLNITRSIEPDKSWSKTTLKLALVIPCIILGVALKAIASIAKEVREDLAHAVTYHKAHTELQAANQLLSDSWLANINRVDGFNAYLDANQSKGVAIWDERETVDRFDFLLKQSVEYTKLWQQELTRLSNGDSQKMADLLLYPCRDTKDPIFFHCFFSGSVWDVYDYCRNAIVVETYFDRTDLSYRMELRRTNSTKERQMAFFTENTHFSKWRAIYQQQVAEWSKLLLQKNDKGITLAELLDEKHNEFFVNRDDRPLEDETTFECYQGEVPQQRIPSLLQKKM